MRISAIKAEALADCGDFKNASAEANVAMRKPAEVSRSLVVSRIDSSSSTTATRDFVGCRFGFPMAGRQPRSIEGAKLLNHGSLTYDFGLPSASPMRTSSGSDFACI